MTKYTTVYLDGKPLILFEVKINTSKGIVQSTTPKFRPRKSDAPVPVEVKGRQAFGRGLAALKRRDADGQPSLEERALAEADWVLTCTAR